MYVIQSKWWTAPDRWVRHYWTGVYWATDIALAEHYKTRRIAEIIWDSHANSEHPDSGIILHKGRKQDWNARAVPDRNFRTDVEIRKIR